MATPPPKRPRHAHAPAAPQTTIADLVPEILLRVPPDDPGSLVRASSVCWRWRRLLTDQPFLRRYRAFYRTPPMLGFVVNLKEHFDGMARFVHSSFVPSAPDRAGMNVLDARHGRVLLHGVERRRGLVVWDPVTDEQRKIPGMPAYIDGFNAAVLCAAAGCDHLDCRCSPFMVAFVGFGGDGITFACTYSSETGNWSERVKIEEPASIDDRPSVLVGNTVYFACDPWIRSKIIAYDVVAQELSVIWPPPQHDDYSCTAIMKAEDGSLGFAGVQNARFFEDNSNASIHLWSMKPGPDGYPEWTEQRVIRHKTLLRTSGLRKPPQIVGFTDGLGLVFVRTGNTVMSMDLRTGHVRKVYTCRASNYEVIIVPYISFYTPVTAMEAVSADEEDQQGVF